MPEFLQAAAWDVLHSEVAACAAACLNYIRIENADDIRVPDAREQDSLAQHVLNFIQAHAHTFENFHCLTPEKSVLHAVHLGKCSLPQETFDFVCFTNDFAFFKHLILGEKPI